jgi:hypothetical protein
MNEEVITKGVIFDWRICRGMTRKADTIYSCFGITVKWMHQMD